MHRIFHFFHLMLIFIFIFDIIMIIFSPHFSCEKNNFDISFRRIDFIIKLLINAWEMTFWKSTQILFFKILKPLLILLKWKKCMARNPSSTKAKQEGNITQGHYYKINLSNQMFSQLQKTR